MTSRRFHTEGRPIESIHIGGVHASSTPVVIRTILGSCISVCLRDPISKVGGMNHFMLPEGRENSLICTSYGVHAMELLINQCMQMGADRRNLEAKVFGGGHVLRTRETQDSVPKSNIRFAKSFLLTERIPIISDNVGGYAAREVLFFSDTGKALIRKLAETGIDESLPLVIEPEREDSNVTLF